jgi:catechol 2,3-dioxygenase-like lactoylglutathione lyase family enzyme
MVEAPAVLGPVGAAALVTLVALTGEGLGALGPAGDSATAELRAAGVEVLLEPEVDDSGNAWVHFRAPDGNIYEFTQDPGVSRPH